MAQNALTGFRKYRSPDVSAINAQTPFLSAIYGQKKQDAYQDKSFDLQQQGLNQQEKFAEQNYDLAKDAQKQAKKRDKLAAGLGYAGLGMQAGFGALNNMNTLAGLFGGGGSEPISDAVSGLGEAALVDAPSSFLSDIWTSPGLKVLGGLGGMEAGGGVLDNLLGDVGGLITGELFGGIF